MNAPQEIFLLLGLIIKSCIIYLRLVRPLEAVLTRVTIPTLLKKNEICIY